MNRIDFEFALAAAMEPLRIGEAPDEHKLGKRPARELASAGDAHRRHTG
jgi:hypothetical protein